MINPLLKVKMMKSKVLVVAMAAVAALLAFSTAAEAAAAPVTGTVKWVAPATDVNGNPPNVTGYNIYAATAASATGCSASLSFTKVGSTAGGVTTFTETGVVPGSTVCVTVTAVNSAGESTYANIFPFTTVAPPPAQGVSNPPTNVTLTLIVTPGS